MVLVSMDEQDTVKSVAKKLYKNIVDAWDFYSPDAGFVSYVLSRVQASYELPKMEYPKKFVLSDLGSPQLSFIGYYVEATGLLDEALKTKAIEGLSRLKSRDPMPSDRQSYAYRGIEFLGICLLVKKLDLLPDFKEKFSAIINLRLSELTSDEPDAFFILVYLIAAEIATVPVSIGRPTEYSFSNLSPIDSGLAVFVLQEFPVIANEWRFDSRDRYRSKVFSSLKSIQSEPAQLVESSLLLFALTSFFPEPQSDLDMSSNGLEELHRSSNFLEKQWIPIVGALFGFITLLFFMGLVKVTLFSP